MTSALKNADNDQKEALEKRYAKTAAEFEDFFYMSAHGDLTQIYRNRTCFTGFGSVGELTNAPIRAFLHFPASRPSVFQFTGQMIHECVHHWFNKKEDVNINADTLYVERAVREMLKFYTNYFRDGTGKGALEEIMQWLCELFAELSSKNAGRPAMAHAQQNGDVLKILQSNEFINKALILMTEIVTVSLNENPDGCMRALFEASRHGPHFSWIWLHIATTFQGSIMTHLLESGAEQFNIYATELNIKKAAPQSTSSAVLLNIIQTEYDHKFRAISDVFNFLMAKRNPELQDVVSQLIVDSLDSKILKPEEKLEPGNRLGFAFFFKLVCCSIKTLQILVTSNGHLVTPFNVVRAFRHVQSVDQSLILPATTYTEFIKNIVTEVDPTTLGKIFGLLIDLVYNPEVFDGENAPENEESNQQIRKDCFQVLDTLVNQIARIAHSSGNIKCPAIHPAIEMFSVGDKLQFIIDTIPKNIDKCPVIVRHLHAISVANDETKAAEIALRFIMTIGYDETCLHIFMSYLYATVPYFPNMLSTIWKELGGLKLLIEDSFEGEHLEKRDKTRMHLNLLHNIRQLIEWELTPEQLEKPEPNRPFAYWELYPGEHVGTVLNELFRETNKLCYEAMKENRWEDAMLMYRAADKLLEAIREACTPIKMLKNNRKVVLSVTEMYKLMTQFAIMLKTTLFLITKENVHGIVVFEELRSQCLCFLFGNHLAPELIRFSPLFVNYFVTACLLDSKKLFNENIGESMNCLLDESGLQKMTDNVLLEDGPSVLEGLRALKMRDNALDMLHTGQLKRRRGNEMKAMALEVNEDATQRLYAVLDAIRVMCSSGDITIQIPCSQQLADVLIQTVCKDALMSDMRFDEWDVEAEFIHRHVEVAQRLNQSPLCDGLFRILAETRSFAMCLPIMKSLLAVILNDTEKFPEQKSMSEPMRQKLHKWMMLAQKGGLVPNRLVYVVDLERFSTCHETFLMLAEVWRYFMIRGLNREAVDVYHRSLLDNAIDEGLPLEREAMEKMNWHLFRIVIQNHLPETTTLYPRLFPVEYELMLMNITD